MTSEQWVKQRNSDAYMFGSPTGGYHVFTKSGIGAVLLGKGRTKTIAWAEARRSMLLQQEMTEALNRGYFKHEPTLQEASKSK